MSRNLITKASVELVDSRLTEIRESINKTFFKDDKHNERNMLIRLVQTIKLGYAELKELSVDNILFYLNYNTKFALTKFKECSYRERLEILNKLLTVDLSNKANIIHFSDFLIWSVNYLYKDEDMAKLVKYFCDNTNDTNSKWIFDVYSVYMRLVDGMQCKDIMINKHNQMEQIRENKSKTRIIL